MQTLDYFKRHLSDYLANLRHFVEIETPTRNVEQAERAASFLTDQYSGLGEIATQPLDGFGPMLRIERPGTGCRVLLLGHYDTVWPVGSWPQLWREAEGRVFAPGVYDMKSGVLFIAWLLRCLKEMDQPHPRLDILLTPDEEVGSLESQPHVQAAAAEADFALVLEPSNLDGSLKLARKGSGDFFIDIIGRSAHQGAEPELGINANVEAAHQVMRLLDLQDEQVGTTVGPNMINGGAAPNSVPDLCKIAVDVRAWTVAEQQRLERSIRGLTPVLRGSEIRVRGKWNRPPMEPTAASIELFERARAVAEGLGLNIEGVRWGGASDANFASAQGAATIDGLGPTGDGAHQYTESIVIDEIPSRLALLTGLVSSLSESPEHWMSQQALAELRSRSKIQD
jgi:glutamate carboxypeptidase